MCGMPARGVPWVCRWKVNLKPCAPWPEGPFLVHPDGPGANACERGCGEGAGENSAPWTHRTLPAHRWPAPFCSPGPGPGRIGRSAPHLHVAQGSGLHHTAQPQLQEAHGTGVPYGTGPPTTGLAASARWFNLSNINHSHPSPE